MRLLRPLYQRGLSPEEVRKLFRVLDWMIQLPTDLELSFRQQLENFERENHMPYITSIERLAREEGLEQGLEQGLLAGRIQTLQLVLADEVESNESLVNRSVKELNQKLEELQRRFESRRTQ